MAERRGAETDGAAAADRSERLSGLLQDLACEHGRVQAAALLGVNYRTLVRALESGQLTERMAAALERYAELESDSAASQAGGLDEDDDAGARLEEWERRLETIAQAMSDALARLEQRLARLEQRADVNRTAAAPAEARAGIERRAPPPRPHSELITLAPKPDEVRMYGAAAAVIAEWRSARAQFLASADRLAAIAAEARMVELELALIETHRLTLPPADVPWDELRRYGELRRRRRTLARLRRERRRAQWRRGLRRALTLGLRR